MGDGRYQQRRSMITCKVVRDVRVETRVRDDEKKPGRASAAVPVDISSAWNRLEGRDGEFELALAKGWVPRCPSISFPPSISLSAESMIDFL